MGKIFNFFGPVNLKILFSHALDNQFASEKNSKRRNSYSRRVFEQDMPGNAYSSHYSTSNLVSPTSNPILLPKNSPTPSNNRNFGAQGLASDLHRNLTVLHPDPKNFANKTARNSSHYKTYSTITHSPLTQSALHPTPQNPRPHPSPVLDPPLPLQTTKGGVNYQIHTKTYHKRRRSPIKKTRIFSTETEHAMERGSGNFWSKKF